MIIADSTIIEFDITTKSYRRLSISELQLDSDDPQKLYWVHCNLNEPDSLPYLVETLSLPDHVVELCKHRDPIPELVDNDKSITIQLEAPTKTKLTEQHGAPLEHLILHLTSRFCFTASRTPLPALSDFVNSCETNIQYARTTCFMLFLILDDIINNYAKLLYEYELVTEKMDLKVRKSHDNMYNEVMDAKLDVMRIKRHLLSIREMLTRLSGRKIAVISEQCQTSLYNLSNHTHMTLHEADSIRDILNGILDQIDNILMQNLNETMRVLTAFASIFLPLTLITSIYGMNFKFMPELEWRYGYITVLGILVTCAILLLYFFKKKKWF